MSDCSKHKKEILGCTDMKVLAEMIGDLHYQQLALLLYHLSDKIYYDGKKDFNAGRTNLAKYLFKAQISVHESHTHIEEAWKISKPFMKDTEPSTPPVQELSEGRAYPNEKVIGIKFEDRKQDEL